MDQFYSMGTFPNSSTPLESCSAATQFTSNCTDKTNCASSLVAADSPSEVSVGVIAGFVVYKTTPLKLNSMSLVWMKRPDHFLPFSLLNILILNRAAVILVGALIGLLWYFKSRSAKQQSAVESTFIFISIQIPTFNCLFDIVENLLNVPKQLRYYMDVSRAGSEAGWHKLSHAFLSPVLRDSIVRETFTIPLL